MCLFGISRPTESAFSVSGDKEVFVFGLESEQVWVEEISLVKIFLDGEQRESV